MVMPKPTASPRRRLSRSDWADAALTAIATGGLTAVAVEPLAARLGATKGSFYWHFANRDELLAAALARWEQATTTDVLVEVDRAADHPVDQLRLLITTVVEAAERDPIGPALLATAGHPAVAPVLARVTATRVGAITAIFARLGFTRAQARDRALLAYSAYLGHAQLAHSTPDLLPADRAGRRRYLDHVVRMLTARPS